MATRTRPADNRVLIFGSIVIFLVAYFWLDWSGRYLMGLTNNIRFLIATPIVLLGMWRGYLGVQRIRSDDIRIVPMIGLVLNGFGLLFILWGFAIFNLS